MHPLNPDMNPLDISVGSVLRAKVWKTSYSNEFVLRPPRYRVRGA